jgi:hypothetical protein
MGEFAEPFTLLAKISTHRRLEEIERTYDSVVKLAARIAGCEQPRPSGDQHNLPELFLVFQALVSRRDL